MGDQELLQLNVTSSAPAARKRKHNLVAQHAKDEEHEPQRKKGPPTAAGSCMADAKDTKAHSAGSGVVVSSLFNCNPEIPRLALHDSDLVIEEVFTAKTFAETGIHSFLVSNLREQGIEALTLVQSKALPVILGGKDALIKSQTGSGKTLAYALPVLHRLQEERPEVTRTDGVRALILVPTRELAVQTLELLQKLCKSFARIVPGALYGGEKRKSEKARLRKGINVLVATPGRLIDHIRLTTSLSLKKVTYLVLDEADRALELGYERDVRAILSALEEQCDPDGAKRQTLLLSATLTSGIEQLSEISLRHPQYVDAAALDSNDQCLTTLTTPTRLRQNFIIAPAKLRLVLLASFILWKCRLVAAKKKLLVFLSTQDMVDFHCRLFQLTLNQVTDGRKSSMSSALESAGQNQWTEEAKAVMAKAARREDQITDQEPITFLKLHGSMSQKDRLATFKSFRDSESGVLLCTDVAARGLDLPQVDWIVQYNAPISEADYVHRVGRTARIGTKGSSLLFVLPSEAEFIRSLGSKNISLAELTMERVLDKLRRREVSASIEEAATKLQMKMENQVASDTTLHESACQAYVSFVRSYASYPKDVRDMFSFKALHLGHVAKSYALRDAPTTITGIGKGHWLRKAQLKKRDMEHSKDVKKEERIVKAQRKRLDQKSIILSEFSSGFEGIDSSIPGGVAVVKKRKTPAFRKGPIGRRQPAPSSRRTVPLDK